MGKPKEKERQKEKDWREGNCFKCGKRGHLAKDYQKNLIKFNQDGQVVEIRFNQPKLEQDKRSAEEVVNVSIEVLMRRWKKMMRSF